MSDQITFPVPEVHAKGWGAEYWLFHCPDYTLKFLDFRAGAQGSTHFHVAKHESWHVLSGRIQLTYIDTTNAAHHIAILGPGDQVDIPRLCPHRVRAIEDTRILEVSTQHVESDSYRVIAGDSQRAEGGA
jgi:mannose-6-phosphate isomerase